MKRTCSGVQHQNPKGNFTRQLREIQVDFVSILSKKWLLWNVISAVVFKIYVLVILPQSTDFYFYVMGFVFVFPLHHSGSCLVSQQNHKVPQKKKQMDLKQQILCTGQISIYGLFHIQITGASLWAKI